MLRRLRRRRSKTPIDTGNDSIIPVESYPTVDLFAWQPKNGSRNFGDHLSHVIVAAAAHTRQLSLEDEVPRPRRMIAIGSSMHFAKDGDVVWGSGINGKIPFEQLVANNLDIRAVRGPKTAAIMRERGHQVPDLFGDPGLLVPHLFGSRFTPRPERDYIVVPNLHDLPLMTAAHPVVSPLTGWNRCVDEIMKARFVVASSLHGIIIAEAFGIPARYVRLSEAESQFKYDDYAQGTGRMELTPASSIEAALDMGGHPAISFDAGALLAAFPYDLWTRTD